MDKRQIDDFVSRMSAGRAKAAKARSAASTGAARTSTSPPTPAKTRLPSKSTSNLNTISRPVTKIPRPAANGAASGPGARKLHIHVHLKD